MINKNNCSWSFIPHKITPINEKIIDKKVFLGLEVKVEKDWRKKENSLKNFGYEQEK